MSLANENMEQLFAAAKTLPAEFSLEEVKLIFLNPAPLPPVKPWYKGYLKFSIMLSFLLAVVLTVTVATATENPTLTTFPVAVVIAAPPSVVSPPSSSPLVNELGEAPAASVLPTLNSSVQLPDNTALSPESAPVLRQAQQGPTAPKSGKANTSDPGKSPLSPDVVPDKNPGREVQQMEKVSTPSLSPLSSILPSREATVDPFPTAESASPASQEADKKITSEGLVPIKWGLQQAGYMADTIKTCSRNDRTCTMQLKLKGKFRLKLNPKMSGKYMILYARPEAIAAMVTKDSFRKMTLRNLLKDQAIDVEINPTTLVGLRIKSNVELIDHEE